MRGKRQDRVLMNLSFLLIETFLLKSLASNVLYAWNRDCSVFNWPVDGERRASDNDWTIESHFPLRNPYLGQKRIKGHVFIYSACSNGRIDHSSTTSTLGADETWGTWVLDVARMDVEATTSTLWYYEKDKATCTFLLHDLGVAWWNKHRYLNVIAPWETGPIAEEAWA